MYGAEQMEVVAHGRLTLDSRVEMSTGQASASWRTDYLNLIASGIAIASNTRRISSRYFQLGIVSPF